MADDYEKYELECKRIRKENIKLLKNFAQWLKNANLKDKTIKQHVENIDFYINEYLLYEDAVEAKDGTHGVDMFLGYWFIKKAMWSSSAQIKSNAASLKKFYTFLHQKGLIDSSELNQLKETIKEEMPEWIATMERYEDPSIQDMGEVWGIEY